MGGDEDVSVVKLTGMPRADGMVNCPEARHPHPLCLFPFTTPALILTLLNNHGNTNITIFRIIVTRSIQPRVNS